MKVNVKANLVNKNYLPKNCRNASFHAKEVTGSVQTKSFQRERETRDQISQLNKHATLLLCCQHLLLKTNCLGFLTISFYPFIVKKL